eukprot:Tbor_TRINITY_DN5303_c7_g2::TRINITY_DN5303_c7_g2_i1::g.4010::m.4010
MSNTYTTKEFPEDYKNPRNIPRVIFIEDVHTTLTTKGITAETMLRQMQEQLGKYKLMEHKLSQSKSHLINKIPEINKTLDTVRFLEGKYLLSLDNNNNNNNNNNNIHTCYGLTESVFAEAIAPPPKTVHVWLGANVLCEYNYKEAINMLINSLDKANINLNSTLEDWAWVRDQTTVLEVNVARVYNYDVVRRREEGNN